MTTIEPISILLPSGKTIVLNEQQCEALSRMKSWLVGDDTLTFTLSGFAGTGKTTIAKELIQYFYTAFAYRSIAVSAPTHKAKKVIQRATGESSYTIQKLLGLRPNTELEDFDINNPKFDEKGRKEIQSHKLVIIDEGSMLNEDLFDLIIKEAKKSGTKILFMGDEAQLPPVNESLSRIFTHVDEKYQLTKVERQSDSNPIMKIYDAIRSDIKSPVDKFRHVTETNLSGEGIVFKNNLIEFQEKVFTLFCSKDFKEDSDFVKLIAYTNDSVQAWNKKIRSHIFPHATKPIVKGDILFAYNTVLIDMEETVIENSSDYIVESVCESRSEDKIEIYSVMLRSVDEGNRTKVQIVKDEAMQHFIVQFKRKLEDAKSSMGRMRKIKWSQYYEFKNNHLLLRDVLDSSGKLLARKDIDYGYAITVHKSQGSTFTNVAISEVNIDRNKNNEERNKLKYVAFSRPTHQAIIFTKK